MNLEIVGKNLFQVNTQAVDVEYIAKIDQLNFLVGENGSGKSTFFHYLKSHKALLSSAFMDQAPLLPLTDMEVKDVISVLSDELHSIHAWQDLESRYDLGIKELLEKKISYLSGGENQRVKFLMALMPKVDFYFFDEPLQFLDSEYQRKIISVLVDLSKSHVVSIIEHDLKKYAEESIAVNQIVKSEESIRIKYCGN